MKLSRINIVQGLLACVLASLPAFAEAQTSFTSTSATGAWNTSRWNNTSDTAPYTSAFTSTNNVSFTSGNYSFTGMGASINVGNITVSTGANVTFTAASSSLATGGNVRTLSVGAGSVLDFGTNDFSTAAGTGFIKTGAGVYASGAGTTFVGGFTLNNGIVILRGVNGMGAGASNVLTLNSGVVASSGTRTMDNTKYGGGIVIGGNVQFGEIAANVALASDSANLSFANNVGLGSVNRVLTLGNNGTQTFSAIISNTGSGGVTFAANSGAGGRFALTNAANTFTGDITITGGEVRFTADGSMGNVNNDIIIDGGRFAKESDGTTVTLDAGRVVSVGDGVGTSISSPGAGTLVINNAIADKSGETGAWAKQGGGTLQLGGNSTYTGSTAINNGFLQLTTGNDRLPTGTVLSLGQAASANLGTFDLNSRNQQVAGLNSTTGTNASASNNTITSVSAATLTLGGNGTYAYGDGTNANSGIITGAISLVKNGSGTQTLGDVNTYNGTTTVNSGRLIFSGNNTISGATTVAGGTLEIASTGNINSSSGVTINGGELKYNSSASLTAPLTFTAGTISGNGTIASALTIGNGTTLSPGNSPGIQSFGASQNWNNGGNYNWQVYDAAGSAGTGFDQIQITGNLTVQSGFNLNLWSLSSIGPDVNGNAINFNNTSNYTWTIATTTTGIVNPLNLASANIFTSATNGTGGFSNDLGGARSASKPPATTSF